MAVSENDLVVGPLTPAVGVTTISLDFYFEEAAWLEVYKSGSEVPLVLNTDYTVTGAGSSSGVVTLSVPANGTDAYSIYLAVPLERSSDMQLRGEFRSEPFNVEMDRLWQAMQGLRARLARSLKVGRTSSPLPPYVHNDNDSDTDNRVLTFSPDSTSLVPGPTKKEIGDARHFAQQAKDARDTSREWAAKAEDSEVVPGEYSALHWAKKAEDNANRVPSVYFADRAAAEAGGTNSVQRIVVADLDYIYDPTGTALATADGRKWKPAGYARLEHFANRADFLSYLGAGATYTKRTIKTSELGVFGDGTTRADLIIVEALEHLIDLGGGGLIVDGSGDYMVEASIYPKTFDCHLVIENPGGGTFKAATGLDESVLRFQSGEFIDLAPSTGRVTLEGVRLDNSDGSTGVGVAACSGLSLTYMDRCIINDLHVFGGDADPTLPNTRSDSGITTVGTNEIIVNNPTIIGQGDAALYPSWNNTGNSGGYMEVNGGFFTLNAIVLTAKRNMELVRVSNAHTLKNLSGFTTQWVSDSGWVAPGHRVEVLNSKIEKTRANIFTLKGGSTGRFAGNTVIDIGYAPDGTGNVGVSAIGCKLEGATGVAVENNDFSMVNWTPVSEYGFQFLDDSGHPSTITGGGHAISGNKFTNWSRYAKGGNTGHPSIHENERFISMGASNRFASDLNDKSRISWWEYDGSDDPILKELVGTDQLPAPQAIKSVEALGSTIGDEVQLMRVLHEALNRNFRISIIRNSAGSGWQGTAIRLESNISDNETANCYIELRQGASTGDNSVVIGESGGDDLVSISGGRVLSYVPVMLPSYAVSALPAEAPLEMSMIWVPDETGGPVPAYSDGTNWRRVSDGAIVS